MNENENPAGTIALICGIATIVISIIFGIMFGVFGAAVGVALV